MRLLISFAALFLSIIFVQLGSGTLGPLDALAGAAHGFTTQQIGMLGSAHYAGFFIGCWASPRLINSIGHSRCFAAFASIGAIAALLHPMIIDPYAWAIMRIGSGAAVAGAYTVVESWLQAKVANENRGRIYGAYRTIDLTGSLAAQLLIAVLNPLSYVSYSLIAIFCCLCLLPLTLTTSKAPLITGTPRLQPLKVIALSPLAAAGVVVVGLTNSSFRMVGPVFGAEIGLSAFEIGIFLAAGVLGGALAQIPVGWLADKYDRRWVLIWTSAAALVISSLIASGLVIHGGWTAFAASFAFGLVAFPLYSVSVAHANDRCPADFIIDLSASLTFLFAVGAIVSPVVAAWLIAQFGSLSLFIYIALVHAALMVFSLFRMTRRAAPDIRTVYRYMPRTSFIIGRLFKRR